MAVLQLRRRDVDPLTRALAEQRIAVIVPAAGAGTRMGEGVAKQYLELAGKPILVHTLEHLSEMSEADEIVIAVPEKDVTSVRHLTVHYRIPKVEAIIPGGSKRQDSVWNCLQYLSVRNIDIVLIHDAVRPFFTAGLFSAVCKEAVNSGAAIPVVPVMDTVKQIVKEGFVSSTLNREELVLAQTPQGFRYSLIFQAYSKAMEEHFYGTDDASLVERNGGMVKTIEGNRSNIKITTPEDLLLADRIHAGA
jgi:2-C-methyl-D-erythritol 4-phosphate cytidylyltransferase